MEQAPFLRFTETTPEGYRIEHWTVPNNWDSWPESGPRGLPFYVVFDRTTRDFPGRFVLRRQVTRPHRIDYDRDPIVVSDSIAEVRRHLPAGLERLPRQPGEDPVILEVWV